MVNRKLASVYNRKSFRGPTPKRELSHYNQLKNSIQDLKDRIEEQKKILDGNHSNRSSIENGQL
jgi:hypothetical protein